MKLCRIHLVLPFLVGLGTLSPLAAQTLHWDSDENSTGNDTGTGAGLGGTGIWDGTTANWWNGTTLVPWPTPGTGFTAVFTGPAPTASTVTLDGTIGVNHLSFQRSGYTLSGGALSFAGPTPTVTVDPGVSAEIESAITGGAGWTLAGGGTLRLSGANSYTGTTAIQAGVLEAGAADTFSASSAHNLGSAGTLRLNGFDNTIASLTGVAGSVVENGASANAVLTTGSNVDTLFAGTIRDGGTGTLGLVKTGTGRLFLTGANTYTGATVIDGGQIRLGNGGTTGSLSADSTISIASGGIFLIERSNTVTQGVDFSGSAITGGGQFVQIGTGTTVLTAANAYTGGTLVYRGTLQLGADHVLPDAQVVVGNVSTGATLDINGKNETIGALVLGVGTTTVGGLVNQVVDSSVGGTGFLTLGGTVTYNPGTAGSHRGQALISANLDLGAANRFFQVNDSDNAPVDLRITGNIAGSVGLVKTGEGTLSLEGDNTWTGATWIYEGTVQATKLADAGDPSSLGAGSTPIIFGRDTGIGNGTLEYIGGTDSSTNRQVYIGNHTTTAFATGGATILNNGTGTLSFANANFNVATNTGTTPGDGRELTFGGSNTGNNVISGVIRNNTGANGAISVVKQDAGTWIFAGGANLYTGTTTIDGGVLQAGAVNTFSIGSAHILGAGGTLRIDGFNNRIGSLAGTVGSIVENGGNVNAVLEVGYDNQDTTFSGTLQDGGGTGTFWLYKHGAGTLTLAGGPNTHTGATQVTNGTIRTAAANQLSLDLRVYASANSTAIVDLNGYDATVNVLRIGSSVYSPNAASVNRVTTGGGTLQVNGSVIVDASGNWTTSPTIEGNLRLGGAGNRAFTVGDSTGAAVDLSVEALVSGAGTEGFWKLGDGVLRFGNEANTYTGGNFIDAGTVQVTKLDNANNTSSLGTGASNPNIRLGSGVSTGTLEHVGSGNSSTNRQIQIGSGTTADSTGGATILNNGSGTLTFTGNGGFFNAQTNTGGPGTPGAGRVLTLGGSNTGTNTIAAIIRDNTGTLNAAVSVVKQDAGTWVFAGGANTYTGTTTIDGGVLEAGAANTFSASSAHTVGAAGTLRLNGFGNTIGSLAGAAGAVVENGSTTFATTLTVGGDHSSTTYAGILRNGGTGALGLTKVGTGTLTLSGANTYTGTTFINNGTLRLGADHVLPNGTVVTGSASTAGGTLDLNGYTDTIGDLWLGNGGTTVGGLVNQVVDSVGTGRLTLGGDVIYDPGTAGFHRGQALISANFDLVGATRTFNVLDSTHASATDVDLRITGNISGTGGLTKTGLGTLELAGNNTYTGMTVVNAGALRLGGNDVLPNTDIAIGNGTNTGGTLDLNGYTATIGNLFLGNVSTTVGGLVNQIVDNSVDRTGLLTLGGNVIYFTGTAGFHRGQATISANLDLGATGVRTFTVAESSNAAVELLVSGDIGGAAGLTKNSTGVLRFEGANTYAGATTINGGVLETGAANALSAASAHTVGSAGTLRLNGFSNTIGSLAGAAGAVVENGAATAATLTVGGNDATTTYAGILRNGSTGALGLTKVGTGTLTLSGTNTFTGGTTVNAGTLALSSPNLTPTGALGGGDITVNNGGIIRVNGDNALIGEIGSAARTITINQGGLVTTNGNSSHLNRLMLNGGTLSATTANPTWANWNFDGGVATGGLGTVSTITGGNATLSQVGGTLFDIQGTDRLNVSTRLEHNGNHPDTGLIKRGTGTLTLTADNTYTSATQVEGGVLELGDGGPTGRLSTSSTIQLSGGGILSVNRDNVVTQGTDFSGSAIAGAGGFRQTGSGTTTLTANNTYTGTTEVLAGTLIVNGNQSAATGAVTVASGATLGGSGTIGGPTTISGLHSPGNSPGVQTFAGDLTYASGASVLWELISNTDTQVPSFQFDQIVVGGDLEFAGPTTFDLDFHSAGSAGVDWTDAFWATDQRWLVYQATGTTAGIGQIRFAVTDFSTLTDGNGLALGAVNPQGNFFFTPSDGEGVYLNYSTLYAVVPEPSSALILLGGLATMLMGRRRRRLAS